MITVGHLKPSTPFVIRHAPGVGSNLGGNVEVIVPPYGVQIDHFSISPNGF
jgi:hypothetical protein